MTSKVILYKEIITLLSENHSRQLIAEFINVTADGTYAYDGTWKS
jgi:hypothetical protein